MVALCTIISGPAHASDHIKAATAEHIAAIDEAAEALVAEGGVNTAAIGLIENGHLVWAGYYGDQGTDVPAGPRTQFNVGSITKTVTTETVLRLAGAGELDLDESMAAYWVDPDIADDPRHKALTPRMALTHTTGLPNWRWFTDDYKLRFLHEPGSTYEYSGEGFEYMARYVEKKLGKDLETLVQEQVFGPLGITEASISRREANFPNIAEAKTEEGELVEHYCRPGGKYCVEEGGYSSAGNMVITLPEYAKFLAAVMRADGYPPALAAERNQVQVTRPVKFCDEGAPDCPTAQGYGLGWVVVDRADGEKMLWHGGSDWSLVTTAYFYNGSRDGLIIFLNAPNARAMDAMPGLISLLDPGSPILDQYELWAARN